MLRIAFIGAGQVNFGGGEGPWNHARRLEELYQTLRTQQGAPVLLNVVAIYDPFVAHAARILEKQRGLSKHPGLWRDTQVFGDYNSMFDSVQIEAVFVGVPPAAHGSLIAPSDIEIQCAKRGIHMFIEKPLSCHPLQDVQEVANVLASEVARGLIVSVGYMFRYSKALRKMKDIIEKYGEPTAIMARYNCAYEKLNKEMWWDVKNSGGPIVEQATHFCDLARYLAGEVNLDTVKAIAVKQTDRLGKLKSQPENIRALEETIPEERRVPRVSHAYWQFESGAIGSLTHGVLLHGSKYESEIEVWGDGYRLVLSDPYTKCALSVRLPESEETTTTEFSDEDTYYVEDKIFLEAIINKTTEHITSPYHDAFETYRFSWKIRTECEVAHTY